MSAAVILLLAFWGALVAIALFVSRDRLGTPPEEEERRISLKNEVLGRGAAFLAITTGIAAFGRLMALSISADTALRASVIAWAVSVFPLILPPFWRRGNSFRVSSQALVVASIFTGVLAGLSLALFMLVQLLLYSPEIK